MNTFNLPDHNSLENLFAIWPCPFFLPHFPPVLPTNPILVSAFPKHTMPHSMPFFLLPSPKNALEGSSHSPKPSSQVTSSGKPSTASSFTLSTDGRFQLPWSILKHCIAPPTLLHDYCDLPWVMHSLIRLCIPFS